MVRTVPTEPPSQLLLYLGTDSGNDGGHVGSGLLRVSYQPGSLLLVVHTWD